MFEDWLKKEKNLTNTSISKYLSAIEKINSDLLSKEIIKSSIEDLNEYELRKIMNDYFNIPEIEELDSRGHRMYSVAFNHYISYEKSFGSKKIRDALIKIITEFPEAITQPIKDHALASFIRKDLPIIIKKKLPNKYIEKNYQVDASPGRANNWAGKGKSNKNPWIAIFNPKITTKASKGFYVAYGLKFKDKEIVLSIGQSHWEIDIEYKGKTQKEKNTLVDSYANILRSRLKSQDYFKEFKSDNVEAREGSVIYKTYSIKNLPSEENLINDLSLILDAYDEICEKGGRPGLDTEIKNNNEFDPDNIDSEKEKVLRSVTYRRGQKKFRDNLLRAYDSECVMSGCKEEEVLQAAHILPYTDAETNKIDNGLLLRADLHNLFDLDLISINPKDFTILVSREIKDSDYRKLHGKKIKMPKSEIKSPSKKALKIHFKNFKG